MRFAARCFVFGLLISMYFAGSASAQYMKILTDNPTDNTRMRPSGTTILTITLDTNHDRNGVQQSCNSHSAANCSATGTAQPLDMFGYTLALKAVGGTVTWGTFTPADAAYTDTSPQIQSDTEVEINKARPVGTVTPPGLATLGTLPVTVLTEAPGIEVQIGPSTINPFGFGTAFGTNCDGSGSPNTYVVGDPLDPCGVTSGLPGDWFDWDGAASGSGNAAPSLSVPGTASGTENVPLTPITATSTDPDAGQTITITQTGMPVDLTFTSTPGPSPNTATISGTPGFDDQGPHTINWVASDGIVTTPRSTVLTIQNVNRAPVLTQPNNMTVNENTLTDQPLTASDPDGDVLEFSITAGPSYASVPPGSALVRLQTNFNDAGTATATVRATDTGSLSDSKSFQITVNNVNRVPTLGTLNNMTVDEGATEDQALSSTDQDGEAITFQKVAGPAYMSVTTTSPGTGTGTGNIHLAPGFSDAGTAGATVRAADASGGFSTERAFTIIVNDVTGANTPPVLAQPISMIVAEGSTANQALSATDVDGNPITFTKTGGPSFATVTTVSSGTGTGTGNVNLAPGFSDAGEDTVFVTASDGAGGSDTKSFIIVVQNTNRPPLLNPISNMTVIEAHTADQAISGSDPDGDNLSFTRATGPSFMTVTTLTGTTGNIHLAPAIGAASTVAYAASVNASDGIGNVTRPFSITVNPNQTPVLAQPSDMTVDEGTTQNQTLTATDADGDAITFSLLAGPAYASVTTTTPGTGTGTGNIHLAPGFSDAGTAGATVRATDGFAATTRSLTITVNNVNRPPVLTQPANMTVDEGQTANQTLVATDPDGDAVSFSLISGPTYAHIFNDQLQLAPTFDDAGTTAATVRATDGNLNSDPKVLTITVNNVNRAPVLDTVSSMTVNEGATLDQVITGHDPDGDDVHFEKFSGPGYMTVSTTSPGLGNIHLAPGFSDAGTASAAVSAVDPSNASMTQGFLITVLNVDRPVTLNEIANMTVAAGSTADQAIHASDADGDAITFTFSGPAFMTVTPAAQVGNDRDGNIHLAPALGTSGTSAASVTATANGTTATRNFTINVTATNQAPVLAQPANMTVSEGQTLDQELHATDADGNELNFTLVSGPSYASVTTIDGGSGTATGNIHLAPGLSDAGTASATVRASDGSLSDTKSLTITVLNTNQAPVLAQPNDMTVVEGGLAQQTLTATDADGDALQFQRLVAPDFMAVALTSGVVTLQPIVGDAGTYSATVGVTDGTASDSKSFSILVIAAAPGNRAPVLDQPANMTVNEGETADQQLHATDPDNDPITYSIPFGPAFASINGAGVVHLAPGFGDAGTWGVTVRASDGSLSDDKSFDITVNNVNRPPSLTALSDMTATEGGTADQTMNATDPDGDNLTFNKVTGPTFMTVGLETGIIHLAPQTGDAGTYAASASVTDGTAEDTKSFTITVNAPSPGNRAPVLEQPANMTVMEGSTAQQTLHATDPDGDALTYHFVSGPGFMSVSLAGLVELAPGFSDSGTTTAQVSVTDGSLSDTKTFTVTVLNVNRPPQLQQPSNMTVTEGQTATQSLEGDDPDGDAVEFSKQTGPTFMTVDAQVGTIHLAPQVGDAGSYSASVSLTDHVATTTLFFTIFVEAAEGNHAPVVQPIADQLVPEGSTADVSVTASDSDGDAITLTAELPSFATFTPGGAGTGVIHIAPGFEDAGTHPATVTATDVHSASGHATFTILVSNTNRAPVLAQPADMTVTEGATANQGLSATDADGQELSFSLASGPGYAEVTTISGGSGTATGNLHLAPGFSDAGTALATISVSDGAASDSKSLTITVLNQDRPPVLNEIANMAVAAGATASQDILAIDLDSDDIAFTFTGPAFMTLTTNVQVATNGTGTIHLAPPLGTTGTFAASVTATANGATSTRSFTISVTATNQAPVLVQPSDMTVNENATQDQTLTATDADGNGLSFSKVSGPTFLSVTTITPGSGTATGRARLAPGYSDAGTYSATVSVTDGSMSDQKSFLITVYDVNRAPVADAGGPYTGLAGSPVTFTGSAVDPDGNTVTFSWDFDASNGITSEATGATATHTYLSTGTFTVTLTATDNGSPALTGVDTAIATISSTALEAIITLNGNDRFILLGSSRSWCVKIRSKDGSFRGGDIVGSSVIASYNGVSIHAIIKKVECDDDDRQGRGRSRLKACFSKEDLRLLFAGLPNGMTTVQVTISGNLKSGGAFSGTASVLVIKGTSLARGNDDNDDEDAALFPSAGAAQNIQPYASPNPFNPNTTIRFGLSAPGSVRLHVYDVSGRLVKTLADEYMGSGPHAVAWDGTSRTGSRVSSGVYFYVLQTPERTFKSQLVVTK